MVLAVLGLVVLLKLLEEHRVLDLDQIGIDPFVMAEGRLVPLIEYQAILLLLTNVANVLVRTVVVVQVPLHPVVQLEEAFREVVVLPRVLIEYQLRQIVLPGYHKLVHCRPLVATAANSVAITEETGVPQQLLLGDNGHVQTQ